MHAHERAAHLPGVCWSCPLSALAHRFGRPPGASTAGGRAALAREMLPALRAAPQYSAAHVRRLRTRARRHCWRPARPRREGCPRVDATAACRGALCQAARRVRLVPSPEPAGRSWHGTARGAPCRAGWLAARLHAALGMESSKKPHWSVLVTIRATCDKRGDAAGAGTTSAEGDHARGLAGCGACEGRGVRRGACASSAGRGACAGRGGPDGRGGRGYRARGDRRTCGREPRGRGGAAVLRGGASTAGPNPGSLPHCLQ